MSRPDRTAMLNRDHPVLSIRRPCTLLSLARSGRLPGGAGERGCRQPGAERLQSGPRPGLSIEGRGVGRRHGMQ